MGEGNNSPIEIDGIGLDDDLNELVKVVSDKHHPFLLLVQLNRQSKDIKKLLEEVRDLLKKEE